mgnify:CR=1 FL=1
MIELIWGRSKFYEPYYKLYISYYTGCYLHINSILAVIYLTYLFI